MLCKARSVTAGSQSITMAPPLALQPISGNIDALASAANKERRLQQNRAAGRKHREKKKADTALLKTEIAELTERNEALQKESAGKTDQITQLTELNGKFKGCLDQATLDLKAMAKQVRSFCRSMSIQADPCLMLLRTCVQKTKAHRKTAEELAFVLQQAKREQRIQDEKYLEQRVEQRVGKEKRAIEREAERQMEERQALDKAKAALEERARVVGERKQCKQRQRQWRIARRQQQ